MIIKYINNNILYNAQYNAPYNIIYYRYNIINIIA